MKFAELLCILESDGKRELSISERYKVYDSNGKPYLPSTDNRREFAWVDGNMFLHNDTGPASKYTYSDGGYTIWYAKHGKYHRLDGPAIYSYDKKRNSYFSKYFINGVEYTKEEFDEYIKGLNKDEVDMLTDLGQSFE